MSDAEAGIERLLAIMAALRDPERGCPWDREQTHRSVVAHTLEEAYEVADAAERGDLDGLRDELGDLLFQTVFYAQIASESGDFTFSDVVSAISDKIVRRHPHVFADAGLPNAAEQAGAWEAIKAAERRERGTSGQTPGALDDVPLALPALPRAEKLQKRAARVGFDWRENEPVLAKVREELAELQEAMASPAPDREAVAGELGDVLFACANLARHLGVNAEASLRGTNSKFERRFRALEALLRERGLEPEEADFDTLEAAYQQAKAGEAGHVATGK